MIFGHIVHESQGNKLSKKIIGAEVVTTSIREGTFFNRDRKECDLMFPISRDFSLLQRADDGLLEKLLKLIVTIHSSFVLVENLLLTHKVYFSYFIGESFSTQSCKAKEEILKSVLFSGAEIPFSIFWNDGPFFPAKHD